MARLLLHCGRAADVRWWSDIRALDTRPEGSLRMPWNRLCNLYGGSDRRHCRDWGGGQLPGSQDRWWMARLFLDRGNAAN